MIVQLTGGLGNQMFCFASGISLALARKEEIFFTRNQVDGNTHGGYGLGVFNVDPKFVNNVQTPFYQEPHFQFDSNVINAPRGASFLGYWQSEKYFDKELVRKSFTFRYRLSSESIKIAEKIQSGPSAFIHVRRGDYLKEPHKSFHGNLDNEYYLQGMSRILAASPNVKFFGFSDDPIYVQQNFPDVITINHGGAAYEDLWLMSQCEHGVIANSSFSWWAAWLGDGRVKNSARTIIAPQRWFLANINTNDLIPERWIRL